MPDDRIARHDAIRGLIYESGYADVEMLAGQVGASPATVRRDLQELERLGVIDRVHGGARIAEGSAIEVAFRLRARTNLVAKRAIASVAYGHLVARSTVFLDAGTTVLQLARLLKAAPMPLRVFTNGLAVAQELLPVREIELSLLGGQLRRENASAIGPEAEAMLEQLWFDQLFLGASAIAADGNIYSVDSGEASLNRRMLARSAESLLLVDATKFGASATYRVGPLGAVTVISDKLLETHWRATLTEQNVALEIAA